MKRGIQMKKILGIIIAAMLVVTACATIASAQDDISVLINGQKVEFDVQPQIINERTMVPLRAIFEALGATVDWDDATKTVTSEMNGVKISLTIGTNIITVNGVDKEIDVPAQIVEERTLVPVRAISESFNCTVGWDGETRTVTIDFTVPEEKPEEEEKPEVVERPEVDGAIITLADAEAGSEKYALYASGSILSVVADADKEGNNVYELKSNVTDKPSWTYIWLNTDFKAGQKYIIEFDAKVISDCFGDKVDTSCFFGNCFQYAAGDVGNKDHALGGVNAAKSGEWVHSKVIATIPGDYVSGSAKFGVYTNPVDKSGYDYKVSLNYQIDNISVLPYTGSLPDGVVKDDAAAADVDVSKFDYENAKGIEYNFEKDLDGWKAAGIDTAEAKDGVLTLVSGSDK